MISRLDGIEYSSAQDHLQFKNVKSITHIEFVYITSEPYSTHISPHHTHILYYDHYYYRTTRLQNHHVITSETFEITEIESWNKSNINLNFNFNLQVARIQSKWTIALLCELKICILLVGHDVGEN